MSVSPSSGYRVGIVIAATLLAACGGGGGDSSGGNSGGGGSFAPLGITSSNAGSVASEAYAAGDFAVLGATSATNMVTFGASAATSSNFNLRSFADSYLRRLHRCGSSQWVTPQQVWNDVLPCSGGGTLTDTWDDADNDGWDSAGDSYATTYSNCVEGGVTMNGGVTATLATLVGNTFGDYQISGSFSFNNLAVSYSGFSVSIDGSMSYSASRTGSNVSVTLQIPLLTTISSSGSSTIANATLQYSFNESSFAYAYTITATLSGTSIGGQVTISTLTPFAGTAPGYPDSGSVHVTGAGGSSVTITAIGGGNVRLDVDSNGDGVVDSSSTMTWAALVAL